jgi:hypothetical protein
VRGQPKAHRFLEFIKQGMPVILITEFLSTLRGRRERPLAERMRAEVFRVFAAMKV